MRRAALAAAAVALIAGSALAACGDTDAPAPDPDPQEPVYGVGQVRAQSVASLAQCRDWNEGDEEERQATIEDIHNQLNQLGSVGPTPDLDVGYAYDLFERSCEAEYAAGFRLYKLYARAAAFSQLDDAAAAAADRASG